jgi:hypothetical protein
MSTICQLIDALEKTNKRMDGIMASIHRAAWLYASDQQWTGTAAGIWVSSTDPDGTWNPNYIPNTPEGYLAEAQRTGQANAAVGSDEHRAAPYTRELLPVADLSAVYQAERVKIKSVFFCAFDTTAAGGTGQDPSTVTAITGTIGTDRAYMQSLYRNGQIAHFQPNWFRPIVRIGTNDVLNGNLRNSESPKGHQGHLSIGMPNPWAADVDIHVGSLKGQSIRVYAQMAQHIAATNLWQRYMCYAMIDFRIGDKLEAL